MHHCQAMLFEKLLLVFSLTHLVNPHLQINLHLTNWASEDDNIQHDCLYIPTFIQEDSDPYHTISYCMSTLPSKFQIKENHLDQKLTFAELSSQHVTSEQLYRWSAPVDVAEQYQLYLNERDKTLAREVFYNCTLPYFGSQCQYILHAHQSHHSSLNEIIHDYYQYNRYTPSLLTCYMHLECNRGVPPSCLDWTEICDGKVNCLDGGYDEEHCWQLDIHQCTAYEDGCASGQCIPKSFRLDNSNFPDCLDQTDEFVRRDYVYDEQNHFVVEPTFRSEDISCSEFKMLSRYFNQLTSSCVQNRENLLSQALFSIKPNSISNECWTALKCVIELPVLDDPIYSTFCDYTVSNAIINKTCLEIIYVPAAPILFGHIYSVFEKTKLIDEDYRERHSQPAYFCFDEKLLYIPNDGRKIILSPNNTCRSYHNMVSYSAVPGTVRWLERYIKQLTRWLQTASISIHDNSEYLNNSAMYQCRNSSKFISKRRLYDRATDCNDRDDEDSSLMNKTCSTVPNPNDFKCITTNECIPKRLSKDGICHCTLYDGTKCNDEHLDYFYGQNTISFQTICDGYTHLIPPTIEDQNETDETNCEQWPHIHIYNGCDGFWDNLDGSDELNCDLPPLLNCSENHHICVSPETNDLMCLSVEKTNDGIIDCLGAADEPMLCKNYSNPSYPSTFYCRRNTGIFCTDAQYICDSAKYCDNNEDEKFCSSEDLSGISGSKDVCMGKYESDGSNVVKVICRRFSRIPFRSRIYFTLDQNQDLVTRHLKQESSLPDPPKKEPFEYYQQRCHRGLDLQVWLDKSENHTTNTCLCPPSYYGDTCQYQNQRISLTVNFNVVSHLVSIPFLIIVSLIDDTDERIIHSCEQLTYLSLQQCRRKFNVYLLYSTRPKDATKNYSIHLDIYEKITLDYRGSFIQSLSFPFLPVHRVALQLNIPYLLDDCTDDQCHHGKCRMYLNGPTNGTFCQCKNGWSGRYCTIRYTSMCSSDAFSIGKLANNRSLCVCPVNKMGPRCLMNDIVCQNNQTVTCFNEGQCIPVHEYGASGKNFLCVCPKGFIGDQCEIMEMKLTMTFDTNITLPSTIFIHFIEVKLDDASVRTTTFKTISYGETSTTVFWPLPFHLAFVELSNKTYYLAHLQMMYKESVMIEKTLNSSDRCLNISELFDNQTIANSHLLRRIKYYHLPCQTNSSELKCFYDEIHLCICQSMYQQQQQRVANCFEFDHHMNFSGSGRSCCENGGECFEEQTTCPKLSICKCPECFYGARCQLSTNGFSLSLDAILSYHIRLNANIAQQSLAVLISLILTVLITLLGLTNGVLSLITFQNKTTRESGCGVYLLSSSVIVLLTMIIFLLKFVILLLSQMGTITNRSFLTIQCHSVDFLLRFSLSMDQWLTAFVAVERAFVVIKGVSFSKKKFKSIAKRTIIGLVFIAIVTNIHDPVYRRLFVEDDNDGDDKKRLWCIVEYSPTVRLINQLFNILHFILPFTINFISALVIIIKSTRQQVAVKKKQNDKNILREQIQQHKNLLIGPCVLIILVIPRLIISFTSDCMKSASDSWLFLVGYFISLVPSLLTFILFVLPSSVYKEAFRKEISRYRDMFNRRS